MTVTKANADVLDLTDAYAFTGAVSGVGKIAQVVTTITNTSASGTTVLVGDDTIPQNTEGIEFMTLAITPTSATNTLVIDAHITGGHSAAVNLLAALFQDSTANALNVSATRQDTANAPVGFSLRHIMTSGTTSETTFKIRAGSYSAGTMNINDRNSGSLFGGVWSSSIVITEYTT